MKVKKIAILLFGLTFFFLSSICFANDRPITVFVNDQQVTFDVQPIKEDGRVLVPLRAIFEALNVNVEYDSYTQTAIAKKDSKVIKIQVGNRKAIIGDQTIELDVPSQIINERTFVPVRFISESLGADVSWDETNQSVIIKTNEIASPPETTVKVNTLEPPLEVKVTPMKFSKNDVYITWDKVPGAEYYYLYYSESINGQYILYGGDKNNESSKQIVEAARLDNIPNNTTLYFKITSVANGIESNFSKIVSATIKYKEILPPTGVKASAISDSVIDIGWDAVPEADYYYIYYSDSLSGPYLYFSNADGTKKPLYWYKEYSASLTGNPSNTTRYFKITSVKDGAESEFSTITLATTKEKDVSPTIEGPLSLYSDEKKRVYLGKLTTNVYDSDSIYNEYGSYGSEYSSKSIWNEYGSYGSEFSTYSAFNEFALNPPLIIDSKGNIVGKLTLNSSTIGAISPYDLKALLIYLGL